MHQFRGTDVGLGLLAIAVNVGLVVGVVVMTTDGSDERPPSAVATSPLASPSRSTTASPSATPSGRASDPQELFQRDAPVTVTVLGDQTGDGEGEWVWVLAELLGRDRQVTLHQLDPQDPTVYAGETAFGSSGPQVAVYNGSREDAAADYGARRLAFLSPKRPDLVLLNYGRNDSPGKVAARLDRTAKAVRSAWPDALLAATLQPPSASEDSTEVRKAVLSWARKRDVSVVDVASRFLDTGAAQSYVSARDPSVMSSRGDQLWGRTAYRLLVGASPPPQASASPTSVATTPTSTPTSAAQPTERATTPRTSDPTSTPEPSRTPTAPAPTPSRSRPLPSGPQPTPTTPEPTPSPTEPQATPTSPDQLAAPRSARA